MSDFYLLEGQVELIRDLLNAGTNADGNYSHAYQAVADMLLPGDLKNWFQGAALANAGEGAYSEMIRAYSQRQMELRGVSYDDELMQKASNRVAVLALRDIVDLERVEPNAPWFVPDGASLFPTLEEIANNDATGVGEILFAELGDDSAGGNINAAWSGTILFSALGSNQTERLTRGVGGADLDTLDGLKNIIFAYESYQAGLSAAISAYSAADAIPFIGQFWEDLGIGIDVIQQGNLFDAWDLAKSNLASSMTGKAKELAEYLEWPGNYELFTSQLADLFGTDSSNPNFISEVFDQAIDLMGDSGDIVLIGTKSASQLNDLFRLSNSYRYAIENFNTIVFNSEALYEGKISDSLENLSDQYIQDRAYVYSQILDARNSGAAYVTQGILEGISNREYYYDMQTNTFEYTSDIGIFTSTENMPSDVKAYVFGGSSADTINGGDVDDHLYGAGGNDSITGGGGDDYLDGGLANDTYHYNTGDGLDTIFDTQGDNSLVLNGRTISNLYAVAEDANAYVEKDAAGNILSEFNYFLSDDELYIHSINSELEGIRISDFSEDNNFGITFNDNDDDDPAPPETQFDFGNGYIIHQNEEVAVHLYYVNRNFSEGQQFINSQSIYFDGNIVDYYVGAGFGHFGGGDENDFIIGADGVAGNSLAGYDGNDYIQGGDTVNALSGGEGSDTIFGGAYTDFISLNSPLDDFDVSDNETINFADSGEGNDYLLGSGYIDKIFAGDGNDEVFAGLGSDIIDGGDGDDVIYGDEHAGAQLFTDSSFPSPDLVVNYYNEILDKDSRTEINTHYVAGFINNFASQTINNDFILGGSGDDTILGEVGNDYVSGGDGDDFLEGDRGAHVLSNGSTGEVVVLAGDLHGNDVVDGGDGDDVIYGNGFSDELRGGAGDDLLYGDDFVISENYHGDDYLFGDAGNDQLVGNLGNDELHGGEGEDVIFGDDQTSDATLHGNDTLFGDAGDDRIYGDGGNDLINGGEGDDGIWGGDGDDLLDGGSGSDFIQGGDGDDTLVGGGALIGEQDSLLGGAGDDTYIYNSGSGLVVITDESGTDTLKFSDVTAAGISAFIAVGNDLQIVETSGQDFVYIFDYFSGNVIENIEWSNGDTWSVNDLLTERPEINPEPIIANGSDNDDNVIGSILGDQLDGGFGDDVIRGNGGDDFIIGGAGINLLYGGQGDDTFVHVVGTGIDQIFDNEGVNTLRIDRGFNLSTSHIASLARYESDLRLLLNYGVGTSPAEYIYVHDYFSGDSIQNIEWYNGDVWDIDYVTSLASISDTPILPTPTPGTTPTPTPVENVEVLDWIEGSGNLIVSNSDVTSENLISGVIVLSADISIDDLDWRRGSFDNSHITASTDLVIRNNDSGELLTIVDYFSEDYDYIEQIKFADDTLIDLVQIEIDVMTLRSSDNPESTILRGFETNDTLIGDDTDRELYGESGDDVISGGSGKDRIYGGDGDDILDGGSGNNHLYGGDGDDILITGPGGDTLSGGEGSDTYEYFYGSEASSVFIENADNAGEDRIKIHGDIDKNDLEVRELRSDGSLLQILFEAGNYQSAIYVNDHFSSENSAIDYIEFDDGVVWDSEDIKAAALRGTALNDSIVGFSSDDTINGLAGNDYIFAKEGDDVISGGLGSDHLDGSAGDDSLYGNEGDDTLRGGAGSDYIVGGDGDDSLYGESGSDTYVFERGEGKDTIYETAEADSSDLLQFTDINYQDLWFSQNDDDLIVEVAGSDDKITIDSWYDNTSSPLIEEFQSTDAVMSSNQLQQLVEAMAVFDAPVGVDGIVPQDVKDSLEAVLASSWEAA